MFRSVVQQAGESLIVDLFLKLLVEAVEEFGADALGMENRLDFGFLRHVLKLPCDNVRLTGFKNKAEKEVE
jgi:hypothetical protein